MKVNVGYNNTMVDISGEYLGCVKVKLGRHNEVVCEYNGAGFIAGTDRKANKTGETANSVRRD